MDAPEKKEQHMKNSHRLLIAAAALTVIDAASQARAGGASCCSASCCNGNSAASPKVRASLNERCVSTCSSTSQGGVSTTGYQAGIAASPKIQQMQNESTPAAMTGGSTVTV